MIVERIAEAIERSPKSRYQISKDTGIDNAVLCRIVTGGSCSIETANILCKYFGLTFKQKGGSKMRRHQYVNGVPQATFEELNFKEQAQSITMTINVLGRMIDSNQRRANEENRDTDDILVRRLNQVQRMIDRRQL